jgi:dihydrofolate reductase
VAANGVIGRAGGLAWHLPDDLRHFKNLTLGHTIIMGRRTFDSIGKPLPGRRTIVVSKSLLEPPHPQVELAGSLEEAMQLGSTSAGPMFIVGGAEIYAQAIAHARVMHLTELDEPVDGDTFFPEWDRRAWRLMKEVPHGRDDRHALSFRFCTYQRLTASTEP